MRSLLTLTLIMLTFSGCASSTEPFSNFDQDSDTELSEDELATGLYNSWDADDNDQLTQAEYDAGVATVNGFPDDTDDFDTWDEDDSGMLSENEFASGFSETRAFDDWDLNDSETLDADEFAEIGMP